MKKKSLIIFIVLVLTFALIQAGNLSKTYIEKRLCVTCGDCVKTCPTKAISIVKNKASIDQEKCINCKLCIKACQYNAIREPK